jgi:hypothetical protein
MYAVIYYMSLLKIPDYMKKGVQVKGGEERSRG